MRSRFRGQAGVLVFSSIEDDGKAEIATLKCVHCGGHFPLDPKTKHWCARCAGYVCSAGCVDAVPEQQMLENIEKGRPENWQPVIVSMARG